MDLGENVIYCNNRNLISFGHVPKVNKIKFDVSVIANLFSWALVWKCRIWTHRYSSLLLFQDFGFSSGHHVLLYNDPGSALHLANDRGKGK